MNTIPQRQRSIQPMNGFTLEEAVALIYRLAVLKAKQGDGTKRPSITEIGHICGVLTLNEQIEVVIKFHDELRQFNKQEFLAQVTLLE
jgi:hypothetical protein